MSERNVHREDSVNSVEKHGSDLSSKGMMMNDEIDWLGNSCLHNLFASADVDLYYLRKLIIDYPHLALLPNKLGRLPLHYAVDRGKVNIPALEVLINAHPEGITVKDSDNKTPYDLVKNWDHDKSIQWLFLSKMPEIDHDKYLKLKYGPLGSLAVWANASRGNLPGTESTFDMNDEDEEREEDDEFPVPKEEDVEEEDDEGERSDRLKTGSRRGSAVNSNAGRDRKLSVADVVEFDSGLSSGNVSGRTSRKNSEVINLPAPPARRNSKPQTQVQTQPTAQNNSRRYSISSVRSFDDNEVEG